MKSQIIETGGDRDSGWTVLTAAESGPIEHGLDWLDAADGLLREGEAEGDSPEQFTLDIYRAATHALQNASFSERTAAESSQDDGLPWAEILQDAEDFDLEVFDSFALEDGFADPSKARADILDWEKLLTGGERS